MDRKARGSADFPIIIAGILQVPEECISKNDRVLTYYRLNRTSSVACQDKSHAVLRSCLLMAFNFLGDCTAGRVKMTGSSLEKQARLVHIENAI